MSGVVSTGTLDRSLLTVLVADDEPENAQAFSRALRGYNLLTATRGDEALSLVAEHRVDMVLTDQRMPGTTGALVLERARAVNPIVRRVVISASAHPDHLLEAINRGEVERYLLKPIEATTLRSIIDELANEYLQMVRQRQRIIELQDQVQALRKRVARSETTVAADDQWDRLELEVIRARRYHRPLALILVESTTLDLKRLDAALREIDLVLQVGGRLVIGLPETDRAAAGTVLERVSELIVGARRAIVCFPEDGADLESLLASTTIA
jgi:response regulator RpfG family c-di-GMP phosphodiesterase